MSSGDPLRAAALALGWRRSGRFGGISDRGQRASRLAGGAELADAGLGQCQLPPQPGRLEVVDDRAVGSERQPGDDQDRADRDRKLERPRHHDIAAGQAAAQIDLALGEPALEGRAAARSLALEHAITPKFAVTGSGQLLSAERQNGRTQISSCISPSISLFQPRGGRAAPGASSTSRRSRRNPAARETCRRRADGF